MTCKELKKEDLIVSFEGIPNFKTTMEIPHYKGIIAQERGIEAIATGLEMRKKGYNIFVVGKIGATKRDYLIRKIEEYASKMPDPNDWCYVFNFKENLKPIALSLDTGTALELKEDIDNFIQELFEEVPNYFDADNYEKDKNEITGRCEKELIEMTNSLYEKANSMGFSVKNTEEDGFAFIPMIEENEMNEEQYNQLSVEDKSLINEDLCELRLVSIDIMKRRKKLIKKLNDDVKELDSKIAKSIVTDKIGILKNKYGSNEEIVDYLNMLKADLIENIEAFMDDDDENQNKDLSFFKRYEVRVIATHKEGKGAPVIYDDSAEYSSLFGKIEYENKMGNMVTDFTMIRAGSLHVANGGFLIIDCYKLLNNAVSWEALKRCLKSQKIILENSKNQMEIFPAVTIQPEDVELDIKIILLGNPYHYAVLYDNDVDFHELFKIKAEFDNVIDNNKENRNKIIGFISNYIDENKTLQITRDGILEILKSSLRLAEDRKYFSSYMDTITDIIDEADIYAKKEDMRYIDRDVIRKISKNRVRRHDLLREKTLKMYSEGKYLVSLKGSRVGEINGLSIMDYGDIVIGQQNKITVATFAGKKGVVDIEREAKMSGNIHSKGILILSGYVGELVGKEVSLSFNASICFEQLYGGIEGDSASVAELIALLSSLSDMPIKQSLAITGSVNQKGEIQPIGGVNEKIEGYFDICSIYGLDGSHAVIIPSANRDELLLKEDVIDAVEKNLFHIYSVEKIEDAVEILCDEEYKENNINLMYKIKSNIIQKLQDYKKLLTN